MKLEPGMGSPPIPIGGDPEKIVEGLVQGALEHAFGLLGNQELFSQIAVNFLSNKFANYRPFAKFAGIVIRKIIPQQYAAA